MNLIFIPVVPVGMPLKGRSPGHDARPWSSHLEAQTSFCVPCSGTTTDIQYTRLAASNSDFVVPQGATRIGNTTKVTASLTTKLPPSSDLIKTPDRELRPAHHATTHVMLDPCDASMSRIIYPSKEQAPHGYLGIMKIQPQTK